MLSDQQIRKDLAKHISNRLPSGGIVKHEQTLHNGNVIADLLAISASLHMYEIKGDLDKISRLKVQSVYYNKVAPKITLVTTEKNIEKATLLLPPYWGILQAKKAKERVSFKYIRPAGINFDFSKYHALLALWKSELIEIAGRMEGVVVKSRHTREDLATIISINENKNMTIKYISETLTKRYSIRAPELTSSLTNSI
jgi:hypothetical protein